MMCGMNVRTPWSPRHGALIRKRRQALDLDQRDVAGRVGVHVNSVQRWEAGTQSPNRHLGKLEKVLGIVIDLGPPEAEKPYVPPELESYPDVVGDVRRRFPDDPDAQGRVLDAMARAMRGEGPAPTSPGGAPSRRPAEGQSGERRRAG